MNSETPETAQKHVGTDFTTYIHDDNTGNYINAFLRDDSGHQAHIGTTEDGDLIVSVAEHVELVVKGDQKDEPKVILREVEYPTEVVVEDREYRFTDIRVERDEA